MARINGIHGIAQQFRGPNSLREVWFPALTDGLIVSGQRDIAAKLDVDDLAVSFYGDLFRPKAALGAEYPPYKPKDLSSPDEREFLEALYDSASAEDPELLPPEGALGPGRDAVKKIGEYPPVQVMIERVLRSKTFAGAIPQRAFIGDLKQVIRFLTDEEVKGKVLARVDEEMSEETTVVIGHSLGSVVAYEYLCMYRPKSVKAFITLGSPLGIRNIVYDRLTPRPTQNGGAWPGTEAVVWTNVCDPHDIVAMRKDLAPLFPRADGGEVSDLRVDNGGEPHGIGPYLTAAETGGAIAAGL
ncbi:hypothetical protein [Mycobacterium sp. URHB0044]|jgi:hypothetical protein|uniref:hypothetical protein n=1 Tax=Mycobacterium sp. URHB0044 TaxID=1380386 RepID=UPI00048EFB3D|nr:hypothetical protein [Mycobacterium sp. URHB0044]